VKILALLIMLNRVQLGTVVWGQMAGEIGNS